MNEHEIRMAACVHPRVNIIRRVQYNKDRTAQVRDQCRMCLAERRAQGVDPETITEATAPAILGPWRARKGPGS